MKLRHCIILILCLLCTQTLFADNTSKTEIVVKNLYNNAKGSGYKGTSSKTALNFYSKACNYFRKGNYSLAIDNFKLSIEADSLFVEAYDNLGRTFRQIGELDSSIYYYNLSLSIFPTGEFAFQNMGVAYQLKGDYENALFYFQKLIDIHPESAEGYYGKAQILVSTSDYDEALETIDIAIEKYKKEESQLLCDGYLFKGYIYVRIKDTTNAKKYLILARDNGAKLDPVLKEFIGEKTEETSLSEEEQVIKLINWYLETPLNEQNQEKIRKIGTGLFAWVTETPKFTVIVDSTFCPITKNGECLLAFMFAWAKFSLVNAAEVDPEEACLNAVETMCYYYLKNKEFIGNYEEINKLIELEIAGELQKLIYDRFKEIKKSTEYQNKIDD